MKKGCFFLLLLLVLGTLVSCQKEHWAMPGDFHEDGDDGQMSYDYQCLGVLYEEYVPELVFQGKSVDHYKFVDTPFLIKYFTNHLEEKYTTTQSSLIGEVYTLPGCDSVLIVKGESCYYFLQRIGMGEDYSQYLGQYYGYRTVDPEGKTYSRSGSGQHILIRVEATTEETVTGTVMETGQGFTEGEVITCRYNTWVDQARGGGHDIAEIGVERSELAEGDLIIVGTDLTDPAEKEGELLIEFIRAPEEEL